MVVASSGALPSVKMIADYVCDGTDDQVTVRLAIDALPSTGGRVVLTEGTYTFSDYLSFGGADNIVLSGEGAATVITDSVAVQSFLSLTNSNYITIENIKFYKTKGGITDDQGIYVTYADHVIIRGCYIVGTEEAPPPAWDATPKWGILFGHVSNSIIAGNYVSNCHYEGISFGAGDGNIVNCVMADNVVEACGYGIVVEKNLTSWNNTLVGNVIKDTKTRQAILVRGVRMCSIIGNTVYGCETDGIVIDEKAYSNVISGNTVYGAKEQGIHIGEWGSNDTHNNIVSDNIVLDAGTYGVYSTGDDNMFIDNIIQYTQSHGIFVFRSDHNVIAGNKILYVQGDGIQLDESSSNVVKNNYFDGVAGTYPVLIYGHTGISSSNIIEGNVFEDTQDEDATTLPDNAAIGDIKVSFTHARDFRIGEKVQIDAETMILADIDYNLNIVTLESALTADHLAGANAVGVKTTTSTIILENAGTTQYNVVRNNTIRDAIAASIAVTGTGAVVQNNVGFVTENSGTSTLVNGTTAIPVAHGLSVTPTIGDIVVTPIEAWGNMTQFYIDTYTVTQFTIHADINPGQDVDFAWKAIVL